MDTLTVAVLIGSLVAVLEALAAVLFWRVWLHD